MKHIIYIGNEQEEIRLFRGYQSSLRSACEKTLSVEDFEEKAEISVVLVTREEIRRLNGEYRGQDKETDVLSFSMLEDFVLIPEPDRDADAVLLGDVIICPAVIEVQAKGFGRSFEEELCLMAIHSVLHLLGYDHAEEEEERRMFQKQEEILATLIKEGSLRK